MIEVSQIPATMNYLTPACGQTPASQPKAPLKCWFINIPRLYIRLFLTDLIPELCFKFAIPARCEPICCYLLLQSTNLVISTFRTAMLLPSITHMMERMLIAKELNAKLLNNAIVEDYLLAALSPPIAALEYDYERLELLGTVTAVPHCASRSSYLSRRCVPQVRYFGLPIRHNA